MKQQGLDDQRVRRRLGLPGKRRLRIEERDIRARPPVIAARELGGCLPEHTEVNRSDARLEFVAANDLDHPVRIALAGQQVFDRTCAELIRIWVARQSNLQARKLRQGHRSSALLRERLHARERQQTRIRKGERLARVVVWKAGVFVEEGVERGQCHGITIAYPTKFYFRRSANKAKRSETCIYLTVSQIWFFCDTSDGI